MTNIIDMTKLPEAREAAEATERLHEVLCIAAGATATGALNAEGRLMLAVAVARAAGGPAWDPKAERLAADGITLTIQGTRRSDHGWGTVEMLPPIPSQTVRYLHEAGRTQTLWLPLADWNTDDVFTYLGSVGQRTGRYYAERSKAPQCARCSAGWDQGRAKYLRQHYPELAANYERDMRALRAEIAKPLVRVELAELDKPLGD